MLTISASSSIQELQKYISKIERERGFADQDAIQKCLLLGEEVGELFKAVRKCSGMGIDPKSSVNAIGEELADVLSFVLAIANRFDVDLGKSFLEKERLNETRTWS